ncbi:NB-ARC domain-containing protein [Streptomyces europaeiscabiei]|uniref:NB-ARC domain-containing protein n=1 Tax=Streptomyces europaeiscabiei TaxID=146819 RepID=UPI0029C04206|nr:NB-ARC domain-containing protein [Streptomyces europaeiscabiei]
MVFISHTQEFGSYPPGQSFLEAAKRAIEMAGDAVIQLDGSAVRNAAPTEHGSRQIISSDAVVALVGFRFGRPISENPEVSHVQLEFQTAVSSGKPLLAFMLDEQASVPILEFVDHANWLPQQEFRRRLRSEASIVSHFGTPQELELLIFQALGALHERLRTPELITVRQGFDGSIEMIPPRLGSFVERPALTNQLLSVLRGTRGASVGLTTALRGAGGFGKTTLAAEVAERREIRELFNAGILWVTLGETVSDSMLANQVNDLAELITGDRPTFFDPDQAGHHLGRVLGADRYLLVIDDVWRKSQLRPFMYGGSNCTRLITTRVPSSLPEGCRTILVDAMEVDEAEELMSLRVDGLSHRDMEGLLAVTGRWPVLLSLVNKMFRKLLSAGLSVSEAIGYMEARLSLDGPSALDVRRSGERDEAVNATVKASLGLLPEDAKVRYQELSIFFEDDAIPFRTVAALWEGVGGLRPVEVAGLCDELCDLSLLSRCATPHGLAFKLHDVLRSWLRHELGEEGIAALNRRFLDGVRALLPEHAWHQMPAEDIYLWQRLSYHFKEARLSADFAELLLGADFVAKKIEMLGPIAVESDLSDVGDERAVELKHVVRQNAHLLMRTEPATSIPNILLSRLEEDSLLSGFKERLRVCAPTPRLEASGDIPDRAHPALRRLLVGDPTSLSACACGPSENLLATGGEDGIVRLWDVESGSVVRSIEASSEWVRSVAFSADGTQIASAGDDYAVRVWNVSDGTAIMTLEGSTAPVRSCSFTPDGTRIVAAGYDGHVRVWNLGSGREVHSLAGHDAAIRRIAVSPDGSRLASASDDQTVRIWDIEQGRELHVYNKHTASVWGCSFSPCGTWVASAGDDQVIRVWSADAGQDRNEFAGHTAGLNVCVWSPDGTWIVSAGDDEVMRSWNVETGEIQGLLDGHRAVIRDCAVGPNGSWLASVSGDGSIQIWDANKRNARITTTHTSKWIRACMFGPTGTWLAAGGDDGHMRMWHPQSGLLLHDLEGHTAPIRSCAATRDGRILVTGSGDGTLRVWNTLSGETLATLTGHVGWVRACEISPDGSVVMSAGDDKLIRFWDANRGTITHTLRGHTGAVRTSALSRDGSWMATASDDGSLLVWDTATRTLRTRLNTDRVAIRSCAFSGEEIVGAGDGKVIRAWSLDTGEITRTFEGHRSSVRACTISADGTRLIGCSDSGLLYIWSFHTGELLYTLAGHVGPARACTVPADGHRVATGGGDGILRVWDTESGALLSSVTAMGAGLVSCAAGPGARIVTGDCHGNLTQWDAVTGEQAWTVQTAVGVVNTCSVSADGTLAAAAGSNGTVTIRDTETGRLSRTIHTASAVNTCAFSPTAPKIAIGGGAGLITLHDLDPAGSAQELTGHEGWIRSCAFSPDGGTLATVGDDRVVRLWHVGSGALLRTLAGHDRTVRSCAFSPDGGALATVGDDRVVRLWHVGSGALLRTLAGHDRTVHSCAFSPDGAMLATASDDHTVRVWDRSRTCVAVMRTEFPLTSVQWAENGEWLVTVGEGGIYRFRWII